MSVYEIDPAQHSALWVALAPDENDHDGWGLVGHIADYLWTTYGLELDCEAVAVGLVYDVDACGGAEHPATERPELAP